MNAKEYLSQVLAIKGKIKRFELEIQMVENDLLGLRSMDYSADRVQSSPTGDAKFFAGVDKLIGLREARQNLIVDLASTRDGIIEEINELDNETHSELLFKRYVEGKGLRRIAREMTYSYDWARKTHGRALREFTEKVLKSPKFTQ